MSVLMFAAIWIAGALIAYWILMSHVKRSIKNDGLKKSDKSLFLVLCLLLGPSALFPAIIFTIAVMFHRNG